MGPRDPVAPLASPQGEEVLSINIHFYIGFNRILHILGSGSKIGFEMAPRSLFSLDTEGGIFEARVSPGSFLYLYIFLHLFHMFFIYAFCIFCIVFVCMFDMK